MRREEATCDEEKQVVRQDRFLCRIYYNAPITNTLHTSSSARLLKANLRAANLRAALAVAPLASALPRTSFGREEEPQSCGAGLRIASVQTAAGVISRLPSSSSALLAERASATGPGVRDAIATIGSGFELEPRRQLFSSRRAISLSIVVCREVRIGREPS